MEESTFMKKKLRIVHGTQNHAFDDPCEFCDEIKRKERESIMIPTFWNKKEYKSMQKKVNLGKAKSTIKEWEDQFNLLKRSYHLVGEIQYECVLCTDVRPLIYDILKQQRFQLIDELIEEVKRKKKNLNLNSAGEFDFGWNFAITDILTVLKEKK